MERKGERETGKREKLLLVADSLPRCLWQTRDEVREKLGPAARLKVHAPVFLLSLSLSFTQSVY